MGPKMARLWTSFTTMFSISWPTRTEVAVKPPPQHPPKRLEASSLFDEPS